MAEQMTPRDYEILRTLARLRFVSTAELNEFFFSWPRAARRRLQQLRGLNLIRSHAQGLPPRTQYYVWRLTAAGIATLGEAFSDEPVPDGLEDRLRRTSLYNLQHREAVSRLYLLVLRGTVTRDEPAAERARYLRMRADQFWWAADGDVVLDLAAHQPALLAAGPPKEGSQVVPDAVALGRHRPVRIFVELDRSTKSLPRVRANLDGYARYLRHAYGVQFKDGRTPKVLYVVRSEERRRHVHSLAMRALGEAAQVLCLEDAARWLESQVIDPARLGAATRQDAQADVARAARDVYAVIVRVLGELEEEGRALPDGAAGLTPLSLYRVARQLVAELGAEGRRLPDDSVRVLHGLHAALSQAMKEGDDHACA